MDPEPGMFRFMSMPEPFTLGLGVSWLGRSALLSVLLNFTIHFTSLYENLLSVLGVILFGLLIPRFCPCQYFPSRPRMESTENWKKYISGQNQGVQFQMLVSSKDEHDTRCFSWTSILSSTTVHCHK